MKPQHNTEELIASIVRRCTVPISQLTYENSDFVKLATDCLFDEVVPLLMKNKADYFVDFVDVVSDSTGVINFPELAVGAKVRNVCYLQDSNPLNLINLPKFDLDVIAGINNSIQRGFYVQANSIYLHPMAAYPTGTNIRIYYYRRCLDLAEPAAYGQIVSINTGANTFVLSNVDTSWIVGDKLNAVSSQPNFTITSSEMTIVSLSSPTVEVDSVSGLSVGDYVTMQGYSAIPQIPVECHGYLAQLAAVYCLEGLGDREGMQAALAKANILKQGIEVVTSNRVDGSPKKVINPNGGFRNRRRLV